MLALRLVFDTNVVVSAALNRDGLPSTVLLIAMTRPARLYVSPKIMMEYVTVLSRRELGLRRGPRQQLLQLIRNRAHIVHPKRILSVTPDPDDNVFLECAEAARADYLVTGNLRHYPVFWKSTKVINPREFLTLITPHLLSR
jgi:putative PIN family toxin of toxin-antitoxin system